ncbi:ATP-binding cassette domain-containing protein [Limimaricola hongkongensis]|uniref:Thiamin ABC transporter, ATPase component / Thiamine transport ATP-binding protein thiQ n=1 Tax=Limimaricola hongkongensis DSM 17492 TaxID=1122180 RepID=A0A017HHM3_9RHOB|nr:ATP-binding cassette domain-containing protein [Limimaricola hongkongensis]EYD73294.1 Thiamin ABC transporter, ATPase component / Thiamine transport ATP-binding protein thiQ [Limimaricola hongkongensis DSM 17492]
MLRLEGLEIRQGDFALDADWALADGSVCAVMGPSGGGKSTLLAAIAGFLAPRAGRVSWDGRDLTALPPAARPISILFQDNNLFPHLTVERNLALGIDPKGRLDAARRREIEAVLDRVGLHAMGARRPAALSGGQQSRAALARVLLMDRPLVLLDEPFAALGPGLRMEMLDLAREVLAGEGRTLMMVSHAPEDAARIASDIVLVDAGRAAAPAPAGPLLETPPPALRAYLGR